MADLRVIERIEYGSARAFRMSPDNAEIRNRLLSKYIAFDTETSGLDPEQDRILEMGAVLFENGDAAGKFHTFVNVQVEIRPEISAINGIADADLRDAPEEKEALAGLLSFFKEATAGETILCGHVAAFDLSFLCKMMERYNVAGDFAFVDTRQIAVQNPEIGSHSLQSVAQYYGISIENAHHALEDALVTGRIMCRMLQEQV